MHFRYTGFPSLWVTISWIQICLEFIFHLHVALWWHKSHLNVDISIYESDRPASACFWPWIKTKLSRVKIYHIKNPPTASNQIIPLIRAALLCGCWLVRLFFRACRCFPWEERSRTVTAGSIWGPKQQTQRWNFSPQRIKHDKNVKVCLIIRLKETKYT